MNSLLLKMAHWVRWFTELKNDDFPVRYVNVYQRVLFTWLMAIQSPWVIPCHNWGSARAKTWRAPGSPARIRDKNHRYQSSTPISIGVQCTGMTFKDHINSFPTLRGCRISRKTHWACFLFWHVTTTRPPRVVFGLGQIATSQVSSMIRWKSPATSMIFPAIDRHFSSQGWCVISGGQIHGFNWNPGLWVSGILTSAILDPLLQSKDVLVGYH